MSNCPSQKGFAHIFILLAIIGVLGVGGAVGGAYYAGTRSTSQNPVISQTNQSEVSDANESSSSAQSLPDEYTPSGTSSYEILKSRSAPGFATSNNSPATTQTSSSNTAQAISAQSYGFTASLELPVIGVKAVFPANTSLELNGSQYSASLGEDRVHFVLENYNAGGRRAWFQKNHPGVYVFEAYSGKNNSGYIAYLAKAIDPNIPSDYYYFTAAGSNKMLLVDGNNTGNNFFGSDLNKFKSFISGIELTNIADPVPDGLTTDDLHKWSSTRKTIWEDSTLGLKITSADWVDYRNATGRDTNGNYQFSEWNRTYFDNIKTYDSVLHQNNYATTHIDIPYAYTYDYLNVIKSEFKNQDFNDVVYGILLPGGFCSTEWKSSKSECTDPAGDFCYLKDEVIQNLKVVQTTKIGDLTAQLRGIDPDFNFKHDCRGEDTWLIKAKDGRFVLTDIYPDGEILRIEKN